jgi:hypothetical protein
MGRERSREERATSKERPQTTDYETTENRNLESGKQKAEIKTQISRIAAARLQSGWGAAEVRREHGRSFFASQIRNP